MIGCRWVRYAISSSAKKAKNTSSNGTIESRFFESTLLIALLERERFSGFLKTNQAARNAETRTATSAPDINIATSLLTPDREKCASEGFCASSQSWYCWRARKHASQSPVAFQEM